MTTEEIVKRLEEIRKEVTSIEESRKKSLSKTNVTLNNHIRILALSLDEVCKILVDSFVVMALKSDKV
jgi:hypothetical protein